MSMEEPTQAAQEGFVIDNLDFASDTDQELLAQVERDTTGWRPNPGDSIVGQVVDIGEGTSEFGTYPLITVDTPSKRLIGIHAFHTVLEREINTRIGNGTLSIGSTLAVKYLGKGQNSGKGNPPELYRIAVRPPQTI